VISGQVAQRYRGGRAFLAGDAVHTIPHTGGFGANVGIQDAHNLVWKLAMVLRGQAGPELLDTYEVERRPVAEFTLGQALARMHNRIRPSTVPEVPPMVEYATVVFGYQYPSSAVLGALDDGGPALNPAQLAGQPGTRAPHVPLTCDGEQISTSDLYGRHFVLLAGPDGAAWVAGSRRAAAQLGIPVEAYRFGAGLGDDTVEPDRLHIIGNGWGQGIAVKSPNTCFAMSSDLNQDDGDGRVLGHRRQGYLGVFLHKLAPGVFLPDVD
jgi:putative polyketide hydroxylase